MPEPFIHVADVPSAIKSILDHYPLVDGPIRELLQNSDDAGATKQIFVVDRRSHPINNLASHEYIAYQNSPALIAYNDAYFGQQDWGSLRRLFESSKAHDPTTFGQFGQGFRCVYHLTDCPQIFSGNTLALLNLPEGTSLDMTNPSDAAHVSHLAAFQGLPSIPCHVPHAVEGSDKGEGEQRSPRLEGTAIRLPLRSRTSSLSTKCSKPEDILKLFDEFRRHDLECVLLFLNNVKEIEVYELTPEGTIREICSAAMRSQEPKQGSGSDEGKNENMTGGSYVTWKAVVNTKVHSGTSTSRANGPSVKLTTTTWRILECPFTDPSSANILERQLSKEHSPEEEMKRRKLNQRIRLAAPLSFVVSSVSSAGMPIDQTPTSAVAYGVSHWRSGRVFSGLPLPRANNKNWPIHVDARFAIPPSRQWIRSFLEGGFIGEWNSLLFTAFIPQAWTFLLNVLAHRDQVKDIFEYWPPPGAMNDYIAPASNTGIGSDYTGTNFGATVAGGPTTSSGGGLRSHGMLQTVFDCIIVAGASVWPVYVASYPPVFIPFPRSPATVTSASKSGSQSVAPLPAVLTVPDPPLSTTEFAGLGSLKVAREDSHFLDLRNTLAECGIKFTKPPLHFKTLIEGCKGKSFQFLEPGNVYEDLLKNVSRVEKLVSEGDKHAAIILEFLLKGQDIQVLVGLPLLRNVDGHYIILERLKPKNSASAAKQTLHPLLDAHSGQLFREYDSDAISLQDVKVAHAAFIREKAPGTLNLIELTAEKVARYLSTDGKWTSPQGPPASPSTPTSSPIAPAITQWLTKFYTWLSSWPLANDFIHLPQVQPLFLIPTQLGLKRVQDMVFDTNNVPPALGKCLRALGISLLDYVAGQAAKRFLATTGGILRKVEDVRAILEGISIATTSPSGLGLTCVEWRAFIEHIVRCSNAEELDPEIIKKLRSLPIYPILPVNLLSTVGPTPSPGPIPENHFVYALTSTDIIPIVDACVFLDFRGWPSRSYEILRLLDPNSSRNPTPLSSVDTFELGVNNFGSQPPELRSSIIRFAARNERIIPRGSLERLLDVPSVACKDGAVRKPGQVIDPTAKSDLSDIVVACKDLDASTGAFDEYLPRSDGPTDVEIVQEFKRFRVSPFRQDLDQTLFLKITSCISGNTHRPESADISRKLFKLLALNPPYGDFVRAIPRETRWIVTTSGLRAQHECRDRNAHSVLFDEVYAVVGEDIIITDALRNILGWAEEISLDALLSQLDATLRKGGEFTRVRDIVKTIGAAKPSDKDLDRLRALLDGRPWVPTKSGQLVTPNDAVIDDAIKEAGFFEVSFNEKAYPEVIVFLKRMDVKERPTTSMILDRLQEWAHHSLIQDQIATVIKLLERLPGDLNPESRALVLVPNVEGRMLTPAKLYFNNTGISVNLTDIERRDKSIAHTLVPEHIARALGIEPLANLYSEFIPGYMGESFISSIRNVIADYTETQTLIEMLANAVDAGAKRFLLVVDSMPQSTDHLISSNLHIFQSCPAILVYNDARFTEEDFKGLCETGEGSKQNKVHSIGQFGRGALTMFHLTEFPTLVSSSTAMFIDPTTKYLSNLPQNANNQRISMETLKQFYPGHINFLETLTDLLEFDKDDAKSFGTVFRLPLRTAEHINHNSPISTTTWSAEDVLGKIVPAFQSVARDCLLFTGLERIEAHVRTHEGLVQQLWSFETQRGEVKAGGEFLSSMVQITEDQSQPELWQIVSHTVPDQDIPDFASTLTKAHGRRLKQPKVSVAAFIRPEGADYQDYHQRNVFFSTLPLSEVTGLPVRCSGTFLMTSDRRHMRLDLENDPGNQAQYNEWLLREIIPPTYLCLLELLLETGAPNHHFWPINYLLPADKIIISSLYENFLKKTDRHLFQSAFDSQRRLTPEEVVILNEGSSIQPVIEFLCPPNVAIYSEPFLSLVTDDAQLPPVSPRFIKEQILRDARQFLGAFSPLDGESPQLSFDHLGDLLDFFLQYDPEQLLRFPLLPLEDGSFGVIDASLSQHKFYVWRNHAVPNRTFADPGRLVKIDFNADALLDRGFNIEELSSSSLASLISARFPKRPSLDVGPGSESQQFIDDFWANFHHLRLDVTDIEEFPLVPTLSGHQHISLKVCKDGDIPMIPVRVDNFVCQCLAVLGVPLVQVSSPRIHPQLRRILANHTLFPEFKMKDVLVALDNLNSETLSDAFFNRLSEQDRANFSDWMRRQLFLDIPNNSLLAIARALPVWKALDHEGSHDYIAASELILLPEALDVNIVAPYMLEQKIVIIQQGQNDILRSTLKRKLQVPEISFRELLERIALGLPTAMPDPAERISYRALVEAVLKRTEPHDALEELRLPNASDFTLIPVREFYSREEPLFRVAFQESSPKFVAPEFRDVESRSLYFRTMRDITMDIFAECVQNISDDNNAEGAVIAFNVMNHPLPRILGSLGPEADRWEMIEGLEFVPKKEGRLERGSGDSVLDVSLYIQRPFDALVAPRDIVRAEYVAVAWSQRALPQRVLDEGLIRAYMSLGRPTVSEVIAHLEVLVDQVARVHPNHPAVLSDIIATYQHLSDSLRSGDSVADLAQLADKPLFLNVHDPQEDGVDWVWEPAARISFDVRDVGNFRFARQFLLNYRPLLVAAGAQEVKHLSTQRHIVVEPGHDSLSRVREKFSEMRQAKHLVDVKFVAHDDDPDNPLLGHRSFLATQSDHLMTVFCSGFKETYPASAMDPIEFPVHEHSRASAALVLDFIYAGSLRDPASLEVLLDALCLAKYWDMDEFVEAAQDCIAVHWLHPDTLNRIEAVAGREELTRMTRDCAAYRRANASYIDRAQGGGHADT